MKKEKQPTVRCETEKGHVRHVPLHLANKPNLLKRMGLIRADLDHYDEKSLGMVKLKYDEFLKVTNDIRVLEGLKQHEPTLWKKEAIDRRIKEIHSTIPVETIEMTSPNEKVEAEITEDKPKRGRPKK